MEKDIVPEILSKIQNELDGKIKQNESISKELELLSQNKANFKNANDVSIKVGEVLSDIYKNNISSEILPDGRMYFNIADRLIKKPLEQAHNFIADYSENVQANLNQEANLRIKAIRPEFNQDRIDGLVNKISSEEDFEKVQWLLDEPIKNFCQAIIDDTIKVNAEFQYKLGLKSVITRKETGNCCDWCKQLAGTYDYPDVPDEVYKRHRYCRCTVGYYPADGKKAQNIHTKRYRDIKKQEKIEQRKEYSSQSIMEQNRKEDSEQYKKYVEILGRENMPQSLYLFQNMKYNNSEKYQLMKEYAKAIDKGELTPLVSLDIYREYSEKIDKLLINKELPNGVVIKSKSYHFINRVFGSIEQYRNGVELDDITQSLENENPVIRDVKEGVMGSTQKLYYKKGGFIITVNIETGNLVQVNPIRKG